MQLLQPPKPKELDSVMRTRPRRGVADDEVQVAVGIGLAAGSR